MSATPDYAVAAILWPVDSAGLEVAHYYTDQHRLMAMPLDELVQFESLLLDGWRLTRSLGAAGEALGSSPAPSGELRLDRTRGLLDSWDDYTWDGARVEVYVSTTGDTSTWDDYALKFRGAVATIGFETDSVTVRVGSPNVELEKPFIRERYRGFGRAMELSDFAVVAEVAKLNAEGGVTYELFGTIISMPATSTDLFVRGDIIGLRVNNLGRIFIITRAGLIDTSDEMPIGEFHVALTLDSNFTACKYYRRDDERVELKYSATLSSLAEQVGTGSLAVNSAGMGRVSLGGGWAEVAHNSALNVNAFTFIAYFTTDAVATTDRAIASKDVISTAVTSFFVRLRATSNKISARVNTGAGSVLMDSTSGLTAGSYWCALRYDLSNATLSYYTADGVLIESIVVAQTGTLLTSTRVLAFGAAPSSSPQNAFLGGSLSQIRLYDRALSAAEVLESLRALNIDSADDTSGLVGYWPCNERIGATLSDVIGGNNAALSGVYDWGATDSGTNLQLWEMRIWDGARTHAQIIETASSPFEDTDEMSAEGGRCLWRCRELSSKVSTDDINELAFFSDYLTWEPSLDGDDPSDFPGAGAAGTKPWIFGRVYNAPAVLVDTPSSQWQFSSAESAAIGRLYVEGLPLRTDVSLVAVGAGDIHYDGGGKFTATPPYGFAAFIAGQTFPSRAGQNVEISGWAGFDGTYVVASEGISANGLEMTLLSVPFNPPGDCPIGATMQTPGAEVEYTYDVATSVATLSGTPAAPVTGDVIGVTLAGAARVSDALQVVSGLEVDSSRLVFDPGIGLYVGAGEAVTRRELLDHAARAAAGWWAETRDGNLVAGSWRSPAPETSPAFYFLTHSLRELDLDPNIGSDVVGYIQTIEPHEDTVPVDEIVCRYRLARLTQDTVAGQVAPARQKYLRRGYAEESQLYPKTRSSSPLDPIETALHRQSDARKWFSCAYWLFGEKRKGYTLTVYGVPMGALELGDVGIVESPHYPALRGGALAMITSLDETTSGAGALVAEVLL